MLGYFPLNILYHFVLLMVTFPKRFVDVYDIIINNLIFGIYLLLICFSLIPLSFILSI